MSAVHNSKACCELPPVQVKNFTPKGEYKEYNGKQVYVTGRTDAKKAIFFLYDIMGYTPQTLQGADILAGAGDYLVVMPNFFQGDTAKVEWFSDPTPENKAAMGQWMSKLTLKADEVNSHIAHAKETFPSVERWGAIGYCWGGKVAAVHSGKDSPFVVAVQTSPAMMDPADAEKITIPFATLGSKDEGAEAVNAFTDALKVPKLGKTFEGQVHGFMSARADLENAEQRKVYEEGYQVAGDWFAAHL
ncbi:hypothetical protein ANO11243_017660 [Dothideomycetidae sp. 11243]|nr:hypothetical protein ANO11243_017660 [fungal sp. No.11243]